MNENDSSTFSYGPKSTLAIATLLIPTVLSANHGLEGLGAVVAFGVTLIAGVFCVIPTLVFLFRKKSAAWASYLLLVLNFGIGFFFFAIAEDLDEGIVVLAGGLLMVLGTLVMLKIIKTL